MGAVATGVPAIGAATDTAGARGKSADSTSCCPSAGDNRAVSTVTREGTAFRPRKRLPTIAFASEQWEARVLATYGLNVPTLYRRAGAFIDKILKGANPADLPVEQPTKFELLINLKDR